MEVRLLGPLEVCLEDGPIDLGPRKQRAVLAMLALEPGRTVSADRLVEGLWGERPPSSARKQVQQYVSRLRRALDGDAVRIVTRARGYALDVAGAEVDAVRAERLLEQARPREALALWRGGPLEDLADEPFAAPEIRRLEELRLRAIELAVDTDLEAGRHAELIGELERLVAEHALRERLHAQLMLALYRAGRQADALEAYRRARETLVDELGIEPAAELRELHQAILVHDPRIEVSPVPGHARTVGLRGPGSRTLLPIAATPFVGRARELAAVTLLLRSPGTRLLTLTGAGGSGKTRLALRVADTCAQHFRGGVCFVGFGDVTDPDLIAPTICQALGLVEQPGAAPTERLAEWLGPRELLLVLDNLEQLVRGTAVLGGLLSSCPTLTILATSREPLHLAGERQYEVPVLELDDAVELFSHRARAVVSDLSLDLPLVQRICERLDCLPLAIELAAARTKALPPAEIHSRLDACLPLLTGGPRDAPRRQRTLRATIDWSYELLDRDEQQLFARLGVFAGGFTLQAAEAVCAARLDAVQSLVDRSLLGRDGDRYRMLQTLREYAIERLEETGEADDVRRLHHKWFAALLDAEAFDMRSPGRPDDISRSAFTQERENIKVALAWALEHRQWRGWKRH